MNSSHTTDNNEQLTYNRQPRTVNIQQTIMNS